jgi:hypothetical protein
LSVVEICPGETLGVLHVRVFRGGLGLHRAQLTDRRLDASRRAGFAEDSGLVCRPGVLCHSRPIDELEFVVGATGVRPRSALRYSASPRVCTVIVDSSAGQSRLVTHGVQSIASALRVAPRRRWRADFRPMIAIG